PLLGALLLWGCGGGATDTKVPSAISVTPTTVTLDAVGKTQQLTPVVTDQDGGTIGSPSVTWTSDNTAVATVTGSGLVSAAGAGSAHITATAGSVNTSVGVTVTQSPTQLQKVTGDQQTANVGQTVTTPLTIQVNDATGHPIQGVTIGFTADPQLASLGSPTGVTGADGRTATSLMILGSGPIPVTAQIANTTLTTSFTETGVSPFSIELQFLTDTTAAQGEAFEKARHRWEGLIVGDVPNVQLSAMAGQCGTNSPALSRSVDDVLILVTLEPIDGAGNVLGAAGPCFVRTGSRLPVLGIMKFDTADLDVLESSGLLQTVILHEMGHVLGYGTIWTDKNLLADPSLTGGTDPHFTGAQAISAFNAVGGSTYNASAKVPVEDTGGAGTADAHWRESVFGNELMTGFVDASTNPLSRVSVASMADLGYTVNLAGADPYTLAPGLRAFARGPRIALKNDLLHLPIRVVDERGRVMQIVQP
ncbi:MAG: leishmanolysin-related zinc metalloendopeptidase, partial [Gemmatimonadales bacterium]